jgi:hypothetical protein
MSGSGSEAKIVSGHFTKLIVHGAKADSSPKKPGSE